MAISEYTAAFTHRYSPYALLAIALALMFGFLYAFNFTSMFGGGITPQ
jgi:D-alanyl-lipoteichoic acid acyltransferase DltB (MBOAT superfamily)